MWASAGLLVVVDLDVGELGAPDRALLLLDGERVPCGQVVQVLLHDHVGAAREPGVLVADGHGLERACALRVLGTVDEAQQVTLVERLEAVDLVNDRRPRRRAPR